METCVVCSEPVDDTNSAVCYGCDQRYHLVLRQGEDGKDCGDVWVDEMSLSLQFACFNCLRGVSTDSTSPAAGAAGPPEPASPRRHRGAHLPDERFPPSRARRARSRRRYRKR